MKKIITLVFMSAVLALTSCNDFLDKYPKYGVDPESEVTNEIAVIRGTLICDFAMTTASVIIFLFVRRFGMKFVELFVSREKIESVKILKSSRRSESIIFLLFLIPGTPKDLLSYLVGLTDIKLSHWIIICAVGRMPAIFLSVLSGNALNKADYTFVILMFAVMIALSICGFFFYRSRNKTGSGSENDKE